MSDKTSNSSKTSVERVNSAEVTVSKPTTPRPPVSKK